MWEPRIARHQYRALALDAGWELEYRQLPMPQSGVTWAAFCPGPGIPGSPEKIHPSPKADHSVPLSQTTILSRAADEKDNVYALRIHTCTHTNNPSTKLTKLDLHAQRPSRTPRITPAKELYPGRASGDAHADGLGKVHLAIDRFGRRRVESFIFKSSWIFASPAYSQNVTLRFISEAPMIPARHSQRQRSHLSTTNKDHEPLAKRSPDTGRETSFMARAYSSDIAATDVEILQVPHKWKLQDKTQKQGNGNAEILCSSLGSHRHIKRCAKSCWAKDEAIINAAVPKPPWPLSESSAGRRDEADRDAQMSGVWATAHRWDDTTSVGVSSGNGPILCESIAKNDGQRPLL
ncbi:hypothetical protein NM208_g13979 [Fusarium decemcellulare]|uniref:Uncharacterized protein n=1 Tax=Fusarium decemcellulare TaxID=57161 RepID=A0ACC1RHR0_9HYPO|nr:hypothetical protein NM208_g13979 [Fusarium decemcellulare]